MRKAGVAAAVRAAILSGVVATIACGSRAGPPEPPRLSLAPCSVDGIEARCGSLTVFENRTTRTGRTIALNMIVLPATGVLRQGPNWLKGAYEEILLGVAGLFVMALAFTLWKLRTRLLTVSAVLAAAESGELDDEQWDDNER